MLWRSPCLLTLSLMTSLTRMPRLAKGLWLLTHLLAGGAWIVVLRAARNMLRLLLEPNRLRGMDLRVYLNGKLLPKGPHPHEWAGESHFRGLHHHHRGWRHCHLLCLMEVSRVSTGDGANVKHLEVKSFLERMLSAMFSTFLLLVPGHIP